MGKSAKGYRMQGLKAFKGEAKKVSAEPRPKKPKGAISKAKPGPPKKPHGAGKH